MCVCLLVIVTNMSYELHMTCLLCGGGREGEVSKAGDERAGGGGRWIEKVASSGGREGEGDPLLVLVCCYVRSFFFGNFLNFACIYLHLVIVFITRM